MAKSFDELRERLLRAGVAPRHVRRYIQELTDHLSDLREEEERSGRSRVDAESAALGRLGGMDDLAAAMIGKPQFQSWSVRAPWATFALIPLLLLACVWFISLFMLWAGWKVFLPGADTPFGASQQTSWFANLYFQADRAFFFGAPVLLGWGIVLVAARQRLKALWRVAGLVLIALICGITSVSASRTAVPGGFGHIRLNFTLGPNDPLLPYGLLHGLVILTLMVLPDFIWRWRRTALTIASLSLLLPGLIFGQASPGNPARQCFFSNFCLPEKPQALMLRALSSKGLSTPTP